MKYECKKHGETEFHITANSDAFCPKCISMGTQVQYEQHQSKGFKYLPGKQKFENMMISWVSKPKKIYTK